MSAKLFVSSAMMMPCCFHVLLSQGVNGEWLPIGVAGVLNGTCCPLRLLDVVLQVSL